MFRILPLAITVALMTACQTTVVSTDTQGVAKSTRSTTTPTGADAYAPERATGLTEQSEIHAKDFMIATANPLATEAGYDILKKGGSAVDAMVAAQTTLSLVEPQSSGLGGGAFVVYWDNKTKTLTTFDGRETAPMSATPELFLDKEGKPLKFMDAVVGGRSVGVPAVPLLMESLHGRYGVLPWGSLFDTPIRLATDGFEVSPRMAMSISQNEQYLKRHAKTAEYFLPNGQALKAGIFLKTLNLPKRLVHLPKRAHNHFIQVNMLKISLMWYKLAIMQVSYPWQIFRLIKSSKGSLYASLTACMKCVVWAPQALAVSLLGRFWGC